MEEGTPGVAEPVLTVGELTSRLKANIERGFARVKVRGEIGRVSRASSGHTYADVKDKTAVLSIVIWRHTQLGIEPAEGLEVVVTGKLTIFGTQSRYQMIVAQMEAFGAGAWMALFEARRKKFLEAGYFEPARKKPLPFLPRVIGIVTSPTGAVIFDMLHRFRERFPYVHILLWPVRVQGREAPREISAALRGFNNPAYYHAFPKPDVIIVARGGGSLEDLWCFNEEEVIQAVFDSCIPVVSAIGHETDTTLADYVADRRAPTPTAAAEFVVPVLQHLLERLEHVFKRIAQCVQRLFHQAQYKLSLMIIPPLSELIAMSWQKLDFLTLALGRIIRHKIEQQRLRLEQAEKLLEAYHYRGVLKRGFAVVRHGGNVLDSWQRVKAGDNLEVELNGGRACAALVEVF